MDFYCVYEHYNKKNELIYVGFTSNFYNRHCAHNYSSKWFSDVNKIVLSHFETKTDAMNYEEKLIRDFLPKFNKLILEEKVLMLPEDLKPKKNYIKDPLVRKAIRKAGNSKRLAEYLGFSRQMMHQVIKGQRPMPEKYYEKIFNLLEG